MKKYCIILLILVLFGCSLSRSKPPQPLRDIQNNILRDERAATLQELVNKMNFSEKSDTKYAVISLKYAVKNGEKAYKEKFIEVRNIHTIELVSQFLDTLNNQVITELGTKNITEAKLAIDRALKLVE